MKEGKKRGIFWGLCFLVLVSAFLLNRCGGPAPEQSRNVLLVEIDHQGVDFPSYSCFGRVDVRTWEAVFACHEETQTGRIWSVIGPVEQFSRDGTLYIHVGHSQQAMTNQPDIAIALIGAGIETPDSQPHGEGWATVITPSSGWLGIADATAVWEWGD